MRLEILLLASLTVVFIFTTLSMAKQCEKVSTIERKSAFNLLKVLQNKFSNVKFEPKPFANTFHLMIFLANQMEKNLFQLVKENIKFLSQVFIDVQKRNLSSFLDTNTFSSFL